MQPGVKSRLPVPVRLREESSSSSSRLSLRTDALQHLHPDDVYASDQQLHGESDSPVSVEQSTSPSSTVRYSHRSISPAGPETDSEAQHGLVNTQTDSALFTQLELLHQECQEKEALINKLSEQLADWEELHAQLQEKEQLNCQYVEALQAAESTIAYLTACNLDSQGGFGPHTGSGPGSAGADATLHFMELQKALQDKEQLNNHLIELLDMAEKAIMSSDGQDENPGLSDVGSRIRDTLQQVNALSNSESPSVFGHRDNAMHELQRNADSLQEALWEQNRLNAELQEKLRDSGKAEDASAQQGFTSIGAGQDGKCSTQRGAEKESDQHHGATGSLDDTSANQEMSKALLNCLSATESAIASLAEHCTNPGSSASARSSEISTNLQTHLDELQTALQERKELEESSQPAAKPSSSQSTAAAGTKGHQDLHLHQNLSLLYKVFSDLHHRISELQASLQEERGQKQESEAHRTVQDGNGLPRSVQIQLEALHKALREKKKACKNLEEKLATALTETPSPETARRGKKIQIQKYFCESRMIRNTLKERGQDCVRVK